MPKCVRVSAPRPPPVWGGGGPAGLKGGGAPKMLAAPGWPPLLVGARISPCARRHPELACSYNNIPNHIYSSTIPQVDKIQFQTTRDDYRLSYDAYFEGASAFSPSGTAFVYIIGKCYPDIDVDKLQRCMLFGLIPIV